MDEVPMEVQELMDQELLSIVGLEIPAGPDPGPRCADLHPSTLELRVELRPGISLQFGVWVEGVLHLPIL